MKALYFLSLFFVFVCASCKKNEAGGKSEITGMTVHHSRAIGHSTVYVKYDAKEFPGKDVMLYDTYVVADSTGKYSFKCYKGDYYLYAIGVDGSQGPMWVDGGVPVHIRTKEVVDADIAVSEQH